MTKPPQTIHWCLGMYGSGSTWLFNVARSIAALANPGVKGASRFVLHTKTLLAAPDLAAFPYAVIKSHETEPEAAAWLDARARSILITLRDPRDAMASLTSHMGYDFATSLDLLERAALACSAYFRDNRATTMRYEDGLTESPHTTAILAKAMGYTLTAGQYAQIHHAYRRENVEAYIAELDRSGRVMRAVGGTDFMDPDTSWHRHHAGRTGKIGAWRDRLTTEQIDAIEQRLGAWMDEFGYQKTT